MPWNNSEVDMRTGPDRLATMTHLLEIMRSYDLAYLRVRHGDFCAKMTLRARGPETSLADEVMSPAAGVVHFRHAVQSVPLMEAGEAVAAGQVVAMIGNGPVFQVVRAPRDGIVATLCTPEGAAVAIGEPVLKLT